jgi:phosphoribosylformylglycinamidine cyclo-ligase
LVHRTYASEYPQLLLAGNEFQGHFRVGDKDDLVIGNVIEALLSPTRQWALLIKVLIDRLNVLGKLHWLHGISINTGGGATKCKALGTGGIIFEKEMPKPPGIFQLIQRESGETWKNMYETFNCGVGIDVIGSPELGGALRYVEDKTGVLLYSLGQCSASASVKNGVALETSYGQFPF